MTVTIDTVRDASVDEWDTAFQSSPEAPLFLSSGWHRWIADTDTSRMLPAPQRVRFNDDREAIVPLCRVTGRLRRWKNSRVSSPLLTYGGWIPQASLGPAHEAALTEWLCLQEKLVWRSNPFVEAPAVDPLRVRNGSVTADPTLVVDLAGGMGQFRRRWSKGHRAAAKQCEREGVTMIWASDASHWQSYYGVYQDTLRRWGDRAHRVDSPMRLTYPATRTDARTRLLLAVHGDRVIAGAIFLRGQNHVAFWHSAALEDAFPLRPLHGILDTAMADACDQGIRWFDLMPSGGEGLEGVHRFKRHFGAIERPSFLLYT